MQFGPLIVEEELEFILVAVTVLIYAQSEAHAWLVRVTPVARLRNICIDGFLVIEGFECEEVTKLFKYIIRVETSSLLRMHSSAQELDYLHE